MDLINYFELGSAQEISCQKLHFDKYNLQTIDKKKYFIVASEPTIKGIDDEGIKDYALLFDTINLGSRLSYLPLNADIFEKKCTEDDINLMLKWAYKHGAPFLEDMSKRSINNEGFITDDVCNGFRIGDFYIKVSQIYDTFLHWERIYRNDNIDPSSNRFYNESIEDAQSAISTSLEVFANIGITVTFRDNRPILKFIGNDLIDVPFIHLAMLIASPNETHLKRCNKCNDWFGAHHGREKYCRLCSRQGAYKKKRSQDPINVIYDREYQRLYQLRYRKKLTDNDYAQHIKELKAMRDSVENLDKEEAERLLLNWVKTGKDDAANGKYKAD